MKRIIALPILAVTFCLLLIASGLKVNYQTADAFQFSHGAGKYSDTMVIVDTSGVADTNINTYHAAIADLTPAASATDAVTTCGSATKTVKITRIEATADATNPSVLDFYTYFRTASDVGGTSAVVAAAPHDTTNPAATAVTTKWTANPSSVGAGTLLVANHYALPAAASTGYPGTPWIESFGNRNNQPIVLRGINQCFALNFNGQTIPAGTNVYYSIEWTEE